MWDQVRHRSISHAYSGENTVAYRTAFEGHYCRCGEMPPPGAKSGAEIAAALKRMQSVAASRQGN
jgi:hypothetical protein